MEAPDLSELDLSDDRSIDRGLKGKTFDVLVNCAAFTDVDACEDPAVYPTALRVNGTALAPLAAACRERGAVLVHFSTDYVFDGTKGSPYREEDPVRPVNAYARTKRIGEEALLAAGGRPLLIRTSWLYGPGGRHFPGTIARLMRERGEVRVVDDQRGGPTYTADLALFTAELLETGAPPGIYHFSNEGETTWYGLALAVKRLLGLEARVEPTTSASFPRPARRPPDSRFDLTKARRAVGHPIRPWEEALKEYFAGETP